MTERPYCNFSRWESKRLSTTKREYEFLSAIADLPPGGRQLPWPIYPISQRIFYAPVVITIPFTLWECI